MKDDSNIDWLVSDWRWFLHPRRMEQAHAVLLFASAALFVAIPLGVFFVLAFFPLFFLQFVLYAYYKVRLKLFGVPMPQLLLSNLETDVADSRF